MRLLATTRYVLPLVFVIWLGCSDLEENATNPNVANPGVSAAPPSTPTAPAPTPSPVTGPLTGTWSGPMQASTAPGEPPINLTVTLDHLISNGQSTVTGTLALADTACLSTETMATQAESFQEPNFSLEVPTRNGMLHLFGRIRDPNVLIALFEIVGGTCNGKTATGLLTKQPADVSSAGLKISFKLDTVLTQGLYMGERWVSSLPHTPALRGDTCVVEARAEAANAMSVATWAPDTPEMVTVSPGEGSQVTITVRRAGQGTLLVTSQGLSTRLRVNAVLSGNVLACSFARENP